MIKVEGTEELYEVYKRLLDNDESGFYSVINLAILIGNSEFSKRYNMEKRKEKIKKILNNDSKGI